MGGPFRAIVGGADQNMSFPPAQAVELNNYSDQYGHLLLSDIFVAPGQIGMVVLVQGISSEKFKFEAPPGATQATATAGQICQIRTYDEAGVGVPGAPPLGPAPGLLLPIGLDSPKHLHHVAGAHLHTIPHSHASAAHLHSDTHNHDVGGPAAWISTDNGDGGSGVGAHTHGVGATGTDITGNFTGNTGSTTPGSTGGSSAANSGAASSGDTDLENVQHTHP
jgi:hypothetical protein